MSTFVGPMTDTIAATDHHNRESGTYSNNPVSLWLQTIVRPAVAFQNIRAGRAWLLPVALVAGGVLAANFAQASVSGLPVTSPLQHPLVTSLTTVIGMLIGWLARAVLLHLISTIVGGSATFGQVVRISVWAVAPVFFRQLALAALALTTGHAVNLSAAALVAVPHAIDATTIPIIAFSNVLYLVDVFTLWELALVGTGIATVAGLTREKGLAVLLIYVVLVVAIIGGGLTVLIHVLIDSGAAVTLNP